MKKPFMLCKLLWVAVLLLATNLCFAQLPTKELLAGHWTVNAERTIAAMSESTRQQMAAEPGSEEMLATTFMTFTEDGSVSFGAAQYPPMSGTWSLSGNQLSMSLKNAEGFTMDLRFMAALGAGRLGLTKIDGPEHFLSVLWLTKQD